jgi:hypothetical protein
MKVTDIAVFNWKIKMIGETDKEWEVQFFIFHYMLEVFRLLMMS